MKTAEFDFYLPEKKKKTLGTRDPRWRNRLSPPLVLPPGKRKGHHCGDGGADRHRHRGGHLPGAVFLFPVRLVPDGQRHILCFHDDTCCCKPVLPDIYDSIPCRRLHGYVRTDDNRSPGKLSCIRKTGGSSYQSVHSAE